MKKSKLHLQRQTLRPLTFGALGRVIGGTGADDETGPEPPAVKSYAIPTGGVEPCRGPDPSTDCCR